MRERRRIRTPVKRQWHIFRTRLLPVLVWLAAVVLVAQLWRGRAARIDAVGIVEARQTAVVSMRRGVVTDLRVDLFDEVQAQQVLVRLDDSAVRAALAAADTKAKQLDAQLDVVARQLDEDPSAPSRGDALRVERLRLEKLHGMIALGNDQIRLQRLAAALDGARALFTTEVAGGEGQSDIRTQHEALAQKIEAARQTLAMLEGRLREATSAGPTSLAPAPLREAISVQLERVEEITVECEGLTLRSPLDGVVTAVYLRDGDTVTAGAPIMTVAEPNSMQIVSFVEQGTSVDPEEGMEVEVRRRTQPVQVARARVLEVGARAERIPRPAARNTSIESWGVRVLISMPAGMVARAEDDTPAAYALPRPGEQLDVRFVQRSGTRRRQPSTQPQPTS